MVTRAVNFKIIVPRGKKDQSAAQALWTTHREINQATRYYEELLLSLRQRPILYRDGSERSETEAAQIARDLADVARRINNRNTLSNHDDALRLFRGLYEAIVPSAIGKKKVSAQKANQFASPMLDPDSQGLLTIFEKIEDPPDWIKGVRAGKPSSFDAAYNWLKTEQGKARLVEANRPPKWIKEARNNNEDWLTYFVEDYDKKVKEVGSVPNLIRELRDMGLLPLARPYFATRIDGNTAAVSKWDRLAIRLAVAHLLSWESWVLNSAKEHQKRIDDVETFKRCIASEKIVASSLHEENMNWNG